MKCKSILLAEDNHSGSFRERRWRDYMSCYACAMPDEKPNRSIEEQLEELRAQIRELAAKMDTAMDREVEVLRPKLKAAEQRLRELRETTGEAWKDLKPGLRNAWDELHKSVSQAASRFKTPRKS